MSIKVPAVRQSAAGRIALIFYAEGDRLVLVTRRSGKFILKRTTDVQVEREFRFQLSDRDPVTVAQGFILSIRHGTPSWDRAYAALDSFINRAVIEAATGVKPPDT